MSNASQLLEHGIQRELPRERLRPSSQDPQSLPEQLRTQFIGTISYV